MPLRCRPKRRDPSVPQPARSCIRSPKPQSLPPAPAAPPTPQKKAPWKSSVDPSSQLRPQWSESWGPQHWLNAVLWPQKWHPDLQSTPRDSKESPQPPRASGNPVTSQARRLDLPTRSPPPSNRDDELKPLAEGGEGEPDCSHRDRRPGRYSWFLSFPTGRSAGRSDSRLIITLEPSSVSPRHSTSFWQRDPSCLLRGVPSNHLMFILR